MSAEASVFEPGSKLDKWFVHLTAKLGREPTEEEFTAAVLPDGKLCGQLDLKRYVRGKRTSEQIRCGKPATGWILDLLAGPEPTCAECDPRFLGLPASRIRPTDFEPNFYEDM